MTPKTNDTYKVTNATIGSINSIRKGRNSVMVKIIFKTVFVDAFGDVGSARANCTTSKQLFLLCIFKIKIHEPVRSFH